MRLKKILYFVLALAMPVCGFEAKAQFYIFEPGTGASGIFQLKEDAFYTAAPGKPDAGTGNGWIRLTSDVANQLGYIILDRTFPSSMGVTIEFDFKVWGNYGTKADGFCVFLIDASPGAAAFTHGNAAGAGLGFASSNKPAAGSVGAKPTYLGVGIDEYGNFSSNYSPNYMPGGPGRTSNSIAIRTGSMVSGDYKLQYRYLGGTATMGSPNILAHLSNTPTRPADADYYRRARVVFEPSGAGVKATVYLKTSTTGNFNQVFTYTYIDATVTRPSVMRVGFSASTGASMAVHEVRNVIIRTSGIMQVFKSMSECPKLNETAAIKTSLACDVASPQSFAVRDTLPSGYEFTGTPTLSGGSFTSGPYGTSVGDRRVYSYTVSVPAFTSVDIIYNGKFTSVPSDGTFSTSAGYTAPSPLPSGVSASDLVLYAKYTGTLTALAAVSPAEGAVVYQYGAAQNFTVNGGNLVWTYSTDNGTNWRYAGTGSPFTPPAHLFKEPSFMLRCVSGKGSCVSAPLTYNCALNIEPVVVLMDSCSRQPYLAVRHDYAGATYKWFRSANGNNGWTEINGETRRRLNVTDEAYYKVQVEYGNAAGESAKLHFITVKKQNIYGGSVWYISRSER